MSRPMTKAQREEFFERLAALNPKPTTELKFKTPFELLVAVTLSAQATDVGVNKATDKLFKIANTPKAILDLGLTGLKKIHKDNWSLQQQSKKHLGHM